MDRRKFVERGLLGSAAVLVSGELACAQQESSNNSAASRKPLVLSTWNHGMPANLAAWEILSKGGRALDAVEAGVRVPEADPESMSVGRGGLPDRDGIVTLDACIMDETGNCGSVAFLQDILHPISVARKVMEETPHVILAGAGAQRFALENGFEKSELLTEPAKKAWLVWLKNSNYQTPVNVENHDTIGMLALDNNGDLSGACTTSGLAYKMHGRVGDSPIIGAGLYVDNEFGAATATGVGELVLKTCGTFLIVELMRHGASAQEACEEGVRRIAARQDIADKQVGFLALDKQGGIGAYAIYEGFNYALTYQDHHELIDAQSMK